MCKSIHILKERKRIKDWLDNMKVKNYTINEDSTVDVNGSVHLINKGFLTEIPIQFGKVKDGFDVSDNKLTSLKGCPPSHRKLF